MDNCYEPLLEGNDRVKGPGHCSEVITDDNGQTWLCYHGWDVDRPDEGRLCYLGRLDWVNDWPSMGTHPTKPVIRR